MSIKMRQIRRATGVFIALVLMASISACAPQADISSGSSYWNEFDYASTSPLSLRSSGNSVLFGASMQFTAYGGRQPYVYSVISGGGEINPDNGLYVAPQVAQSVTIEARDVEGQTAIAIIDVQASQTTNPPVGGGMTYKPGLTHVSVGFDGSSPPPAGAQVGCPSNTSVVGTVGNGLGNPIRIFGNRQVCAAAEQVTANSDVIVDLILTQGGLHSDTVNCPIGYEAMGSVMDCFGGVCAGQQFICGKKAKVSASPSYVSNFYVSQAGMHYPTGPGCPIGYLTVGVTIDCGGGVCNGYQHLCQSK